MEFANFTTLVRDEVEKRTGENYRVRLNDVRKNNGVMLRGLTVMQDDSNISPTIYLNNYYEAYEDGRISLGYVVNDVMDTYNRNKVNRSVDMRCFLDYESVKGSIVYKLVNTQKNRELLEDVPHLEFLDLSVVFQCLIAKEDFGTASILVHNAHLKLWDVTAEELYRVARSNTPRLQEYEIKSMKETICEIMEEDSAADFDQDACMAELDNGVPMYVLSNKSRVEGAACMLYPQLIKDFADTVESSLYIIPSSVHEVLLLPTQDTAESGKIKDMIRDINDTQVRVEEILSYSLYFYDRSQGKMMQL